MDPDDWSVLCPSTAGNGPWVGHHSCTHHVPLCGSSFFFFLSSVDLLNIYSLSLPGSVKISPSLMGVCLAWDGAGNEAATTGLEELTATLPWGKEVKHISGGKFPTPDLPLLWRCPHRSGHCSDSF